MTKVTHRFGNRPEGAKLEKFSLTTHRLSGVDYRIAFGQYLLGGKEHQARDVIGTVREHDGKEVFSSFRPNGAAKDAIKEQVIEAHLTSFYFFEMKTSLEQHGTVNGMAAFGFKEYKPAAETIMTAIMLG
jgi:hypothetical protein